MRPRTKDRVEKPADAPRLSRAKTRAPDEPAVASRSAGNLADQHQAGSQRASPGLAIQRSPTAPAAATPKADPSAPETAAPGLIVANDVTPLAPGQMHRDRFLALLRASVSTTAESALAGTVWSVAGCPWIDHWFNYYAGRSARDIEQAVRRYVPEAAGATSAGDYIPLITARVRHAIGQWTTTGDMSDVAVGVSAGWPAGGPGGLAEAVTGVGTLVSGMGGLLFKAGEGGAKTNADPRQVQSQLHSGRQLDSRMRAQAESVFGQDLSGVRVHTDTPADRLAGQLNARAFTVGQDIAFGRGQYQPGTLIGDALIAHELAHTVQQSQADPDSVHALEMGAVGSLLEDAADGSAVAVVAAHYGLQPQALVPRLRTGLRLQRCKSDREKEIERLAGLQRSLLEQRAREQERQRREQQRQQEIARLRNQGVANPEQQVPEVQVDQIEVTPESVRDELSRTVAAATPPPNPISRWQNLPDQAAYLRAARTIISRIKTTAQADPQYSDIARLVTQVPLVFDAETAKTGLREGWYAWNRGTNVAVSMNFIDDARGDVRNVFPVIGHEIGGHPSYTDYLYEISEEILSGLDPTLRSRLVGTADQRQDYYMTYAYQATEIYAAVRQRRYDRGIPGFTPQHGAIDPDTNIALRLTQLRDRWHPQVVKAVLQDLLRQLAANAEVRQDDITFLRGQITAVMGYSLPLAGKEMRP